MANEIYSSSWWGNGVCDNTIDWGISYKDLAGCTPAFSNTYSLAFDGVDDQVNFPDIPFLKAGGSYFSISAWVYTTHSTQAGYWSCRSSTTNQMNLFRDSSKYCRFQLQSSTGGGTMLVRSDTVQIPDNTWTHIAVTFDGTESTATDKLKLYINGSYVSQVVTGSNTGLPQGTATVLNYIGRTFSGIRQTGNIDELDIWDSTLTASNITSIYNSGSPNDITSLNPLSWWRMGDEATWDGSKWTLTDQGSGGFDADSVNMVEADRETETP